MKHELKVKLNLKVKVEIECRNRYNWIMYNTIYLLLRWINFEIINRMTINYYINKEISHSPHDKLAARNDILIIKKTEDKERSLLKQGGSLNF